MDPRRLALEILTKLNEGNTTLDALLSEVDENEGRGLDRRDRGLFNSILFGVLRHRARLDYVINKFLKKPISTLDTHILNILRIGAFQIVCLDRVPVSAAVNTSVETVKASTTPWAAGFVNGVLRSIVRGYEKVAFPSIEKNSIQAIAVEESFPEWLVKKRIKRLGVDATLELCRAENIVPPLSLRVNTLLTSQKNMLEEIQDKAAEVFPSKVSSVGIVVNRPKTPVHLWEEFAQGKFTVQDIAAQMVASLLDPKPGETVLDACAGLGGKTGHIAQHMKNEGRLIAIDSAKAKLALLEKDMKRLKISIVESICFDLKTPLSAARLNGVQFDKVLLDAPCSGLGVLRRNPDAKWNKKNLKANKTKQIMLLSNLVDCVKPGGILVYSVCTNEPEETVEVKEAFLKKNPEFSIQEMPGITNHEGCMETSPTNLETDGFYGVRFVKKA